MDNFLKEKMIWLCSFYYLFFLSSLVLFFSLFLSRSLSFMAVSLCLSACLLVALSLFSLLIEVTFPPTHCISFSFPHSVPCFVKFPALPFCPFSPINESSASLKLVAHDARLLKFHLSWILWLSSV